MDVRLYSGLNLVGNSCKVERYNLNCAEAIWFSNETVKVKGDGLF